MEAIETLRTWLSNRGQLGDRSTDHYQANCIIHPLNESLLTQFNLPDLRLRHLHKPSLLTTLKRTKQQGSIELHDVVQYLSEFLLRLKNQRCELECLLKLCNPTLSGQLIGYHLDEAIELVKSALSFDNQSLDLSHFSRLVDYIEVEQVANKLHLHHLLGQILMRLLTQTPAYLFVQASSYEACLLCTYLVDMLQASGAPKSHLQLFACSDVAGSLSSILKHRRTIHEQSNSDANNNIKRKQQTALYICLSDANIQRAVTTILQSYLREADNNLQAIVLIEQSIYRLFVESWQTNYSKCLSANDTDLGLLEVCVDLNSIDMAVARKTRGSCINMIKFHSIEELHKLLANLKSANNSIVLAQFWTKDVDLTRQLAGFKSCSKRKPLDQSVLAKRCQIVWHNNLPTTMSGSQFQWQLIDHFRSLMRARMDEAYSETLRDFEYLIERLKRQQVAINRGQKSLGERNKLILHSYLALISKFKSLKPLGQSVEDSFKRLVSFANFRSHQINEQEGQYRIERIAQPTGLAILHLDDKTCVKSKAAIIDFIYKNLIILNAVLVICPKNLLGVRFPHDLLADGKLSFALVELDQDHLEASYCRPNSSDAGTESSPRDVDATTPIKKQELIGSSPSTTKINALDSGELTSHDTSGISVSSSSVLRRASSLRVVKCPRSIYIIKLSKIPSEQQLCSELTCELSETFVSVLGCRYRSMWLDVEDLQHRAGLITNLDVSRGDVGVISEEEEEIKASNLGEEDEENQASEDSANRSSSSSSSSSSLGFDEFHQEEAHRSRWIGECYTSSNASLSRAGSSEDEI